MFILLSLWFHPSLLISVCLRTGNPHWRGRLSTVDLLVITSLVKLLLILKHYLLSNKTSYLNEEVNRTDLSPSVSVPCSGAPLGVDLLGLICKLDIFWELIKDLQTQVWYNLQRIVSTFTPDFLYRICSSGHGAVLRLCKMIKLRAQRLLIKMTQILRVKFYNKMSSLVQIKFITEDSKWLHYKY